MPGGAADLERAGTIFTRLGPRLFGIAYRMLGSATEAEGLVQEAWLAINALQSARFRRETYIGPWLPEPVDTSADNPEKITELSLPAGHVFPVRFADVRASRQ